MTYRRKKVREEAKEDAITEDVGGPSCSNPCGRRFQEEGRSSTEARLKNYSSTEVHRDLEDVNKDKEHEQTTFRPQGFIRQEH